LESWIGPPADLFAWGATMLYAATGHSPFEAGAYVAVVHRIMNVDPDLSALDGQLADVVGHCLAKDPEERPGAQEVLLRLIGHTEPPESHPGTVPLPPPHYFPLPVPTRESTPLPASPPPPVPAYLAPEPTPTSPAAPATRTLGHSPVMVTGLALAVLLSALLVVLLGNTLFDPKLSGQAKASTLLAHVAFAGLSAATLVAVVGAWRGSRTAVWAIIALQAAHCGLWLAWTSNPIRVLVKYAATPQVALHVAVPAIIIALLGWALWRTRAP
jgi:hypothetical protein